MYEIWRCWRDAALLFAFTAVWRLQPIRRRRSIKIYGFILSFIQFGCCMFSLVHCIFNVIVSLVVANVRKTCNILGWADLRFADRKGERHIKQNPTINETPHPSLCRTTSNFNRLPLVPLSEYVQTHQRAQLNFKCTVAIIKDSIFSWILWKCVSWQKKTVPACHRRVLRIVAQIVFRKRLRITEITRCLLRSSNCDYLETA